MIYTFPPLSLSFHFTLSRTFHLALFILLCHRLISFVDFFVGLCIFYCTYPPHSFSIYLIHFPFTSFIFHLPNLIHCFTSPVASLADSNKFPTDQAFVSILSHVLDGVPLYIHHQTCRWFAIVSQCWIFLVVLAPWSESSRARGQSTAFGGNFQLSGCVA